MLALLGIALKFLDWGKTLMGWIGDLFSAIFQIALKYPLQFTIAVLLLVAAFFGYEWHSKDVELKTAKATIVSKQAFIDAQGARLNQYVEALNQEKATLQQTVATNNAAVASLKTTANNALAGAQKAALASKAKSQAYMELATKYQVANPSTGTAEQRIQKEQATTDQFISDWRKQ